MRFCDCIEVDNNGVGELGDSEVGGGDGGGEAAVNWQNARYKAEGGNLGDDKELDQFMVQFMPHYVLLLCSFKEQLQQHVRVHAMEAVMAWVSPGEGTGATMSDDDDDQVDSDANLFDGMG
ncbi:hypothetical protein HanPI659440_Chr06g0221841 [Helianthus annuus]|nr:hypothetical protein HanPI659440_Chr06g0221841 [Helianthus annuus]